MISPLEAIEAARPKFANYAHTRGDVWRDHDAIHVDGIHDEQWRAIQRAVADADASDGPSPIGIAVTGRAGSGKTHMLSRVRELVQQKYHGYFILLEMFDTQDFWRRTLASIVNSFHQNAPERESQLHYLLWQLSDLAALNRMERRAVSGETEITPEVLDKFVNGLAKHNGNLVRQYRLVLRALVLMANSDTRDIGDAMINNYLDDVDEADRARWKVPAHGLEPVDVVRGISEFMALTGPTVLAVDQIDTMLQQADSGGSATKPTRQLEAVEKVGHGLMSLRENLSRTISIVACLPNAWELIQAHATASVPDRFRTIATLENVPDTDTAKRVVTKRLHNAWANIGFNPPHDCWPVSPEAITGSSLHTTRQLLKAVDAHLEKCLATGVISELMSFAADASTNVPATTTAYGKDLHSRFESLRGHVKVGDAFDAALEDQTMSQLLAAGLDAWIRETGSDAYSVDRGRKPFALHARLRQTLDAETEDQQHWSFRSINASNYSAAKARITKSSAEAGLDREIPRRKLVLIRNSPWPNGKSVANALETFAAAGGETRRLSDDDVRSLGALSTLVAESPPGLAAWLLERQPAHSISLFAEFLKPSDSSRTPAPERPLPATASTQTPSPANSLPTVTTPPVTTPIEDSIPLGFAEDGSVVWLAIEALRKHTSIFAGSGSGKTVLIKRMVEELALQGVSSIVIDLNNDMARLGDRWPVRPAAMSDADWEKSREYHDNVEVKIWTPGHSAAPLSFQPLPEFSEVMKDEDEFNQAISAACSALEAHAGAKTNSQRAVLKEALVSFAESGGSSLGGLVEVLRSFTLSRLADGERLGFKLGENLQASMINNSLLGGKGAPAEPAVLLTPSPGKRARISVISCVGLPDDTQRQTFVNQLQLTLFSWVKKHPAPTGLGGLLVMDEARMLAPSGKYTPSTESSIVLASQARKYGLALMFATQGPKDVNAKIVANTATQFIGRLISGAAIGAATELARAKQSSVGDIGHLGAGQFYAAPDGGKFTLIRTPLCLSHHPASPPPDEVVIEMAAAGGRG